MATKSKKSGTVHVLPSPKGEWVVKKGGSPKPVKTFKKKTAATAYAKTLVTKAKKGSAAKKVMAKEGAAKKTGGLVMHTSKIFDSKVAKGGKISQVGVAKSAKRPKPQFGSAEGKFKMAEDFNSLPEEFSEYTG